MKCTLKLVAIACSFTLSHAAFAGGPASHAAPRIDYEGFLRNHDMVWDRIPTRWEVAPYAGNGKVGFLFYQAKGAAKNVISLHAGRHDYYDHRLPDNGNANSWISRCRLPLGRFDLQSKGDISGVDLRLDLWNAELRGTVTTTLGSYKIHALTHSSTDLIYCSTEAQNGETVTITWQPEEPYSSVRKTLEAGGGPKGGSWDAMRTAPYHHKLPTRCAGALQSGVRQRPGRICTFPGQRILERVFPDRPYRYACSPRDGDPRRQGQIHPRGYRQTLRTSDEGEWNPLRPAPL